MTILLRQKPLPQVVRQIVQRDNGAWLDPSDMTTMFQDAAGTIPVTAVEQPVGLMLDKARGGMLGPELVSNGTFDSGISGWVAPNGGWSWDASGKAKINGDGTGQTFLMSPATLTAGKFYKVTVDLSITGGTLGIFTGADVLIASGSSGKLTAYFYASTSFYFKRSSGTLTGTIDNVSIKELYGYHATQSITASRPVLSARYNLLTKTEDFSDAVWTKANLTNPTYPPVVTPDAAIGPDGITYADLVTPANIAGSSFIEVYQNSTIISGTKYHQYYCVKPNGWRYLQSIGNGAVFGSGHVNFDLVTGTVTANTPGTGGVSGDITPLANGWFLLHVSATAIANGTSHLSINFIDSATASRGQVATGNGVDGVYVTRGDFRAAAEQNSYQRVNTATDYDTDERYFHKYLRLDGVDDYLNLPYMGLYANGSASVVLSARMKQHAITQYIVCESAISASASRYSLGMIQANLNLYSALIRTDDNVELINQANASTIIQETTAVCSTIDSGLSVQIVSNSKNKVSSNYNRSTTLTVDTTTIGALGQGSRSLFFTGNLYGLIITKSALTDSQRIACERYLGRKSGVQL